MKKFFLFKREEPQEYHNSKSDTGEALSILAIPADSLSYMTAAKGSVDILFNNASPYEESNLTDGESIEKTEVRVGCQQGRELELMEAIMNFISRDSKQNIMRFDALEIANTFPENSGFTTINAKVRQNPIKRVDQSISTQTFIGVDNTSGALTPATTTIAGIDFLSASNLPIIDYNEVVLEGKSYSDGANITHWDNDSDAVPGTGNTFDLHPSDNNPVYRDATTYISTGWADFRGASSAQHNFMISSNASTAETLTVYGDYTMYMALILTPNNYVSAIYAGDSDATNGPFPLKSIGSEFKFEFSNSTSAFKSNKQSTSSFPGTGTTLDSSNVLFSFVIRRDANNDVFVYDRNGKIAASIPYDGTNDGQLIINKIGAALIQHSAGMARFGVINKDMGNDFCVGLGPALYDRYKV